MRNTVSITVLLSILILSVLATTSSAYNFKSKKILMPINVSSVNPFEYRNKLYLVVGDQEGNFFLVDASSNTMKYLGKYYNPIHTSILQILFINNTPYFLVPRDSSFEYTVFINLINNKTYVLNTYNTYIVNRNGTYIIGLTGTVGTTVMTGNSYETTFIGIFNSSLKLVNSTYIPIGIKAASYISNDEFCTVTKSYQRRNNLLGIVEETSLGILCFNNSLYPTYGKVLYENNGNFKVLGAAEENYYGAYIDGKIFIGRFKGKAINISTSINPYSLYADNGIKVLGNYILYYVTDGSKTVFVLFDKNLNIIAVKEIPYRTVYLGASSGKFVLVALRRNGAEVYYISPNDIKAVYYPITFKAVLAGSLYFINYNGKIIEIYDVIDTPLGGKIINHNYFIAVPIIGLIIARYWLK